MKPGRPEVKKEDKLSARITVNVTQSEKEDLEQLADDDNGRTLPAWSRIQLTKLIKG